MLTDFGIQCDSPLKSQMLLRLNHWLLDRYRAGETAVLIVDEAQNLSPHVLEEIRMLTNLETSTEKLLQIVLCGQTELEQKLNLPELRQLRQRITLRCKTHPLTREETAAYIAQRLTIAGCNGHAIFTPEAVNMVHSCSDGIPRIINVVCDHALISAFVDRKNQVDADIVHSIAREFELPQRTTASPLARPGDGQSLVEALQNLVSLTERLRAQRELPKKGQHEPNS
jgi:DNA transposition AAA+ family ATPase